MAANYTSPTGSKKGSTENPARCNAVCATPPGGNNIEGFVWNTVATTDPDKVNCVYCFHATWGRWPRGNEKNTGRQS